MEKGTRKAGFHLPGMFEFFDFYKVFLRLFYEHREFFYDWAEIASIYGAPDDCIWGGGRFEHSDAGAGEVFSLLREYGISARLTFSNSLLREEHLADRKCNRLCAMLADENRWSPENRANGEPESTTEKQMPNDFERLQEKRISNGSEKISESQATNKSEKPSESLPMNESGELSDNENREPVQKNTVRNGIIVHSELLLEYLRKKYPGLYMVSSTTKVLTEFEQFTEELRRAEFEYIVPDFRLNRQLDRLNTLTQKEKDKVEFLCNECCYTGCRDRKACYENVSRRILGEECTEHICTAPDGGEGYLFSRAMKNPSFIGVDDIENIYLPAGFTNFKIEGRGLGSALILEFLLHYMAKPEYHLQIREKIYLDSMLNLF